MFRLESQFESKTMPVPGSKHPPSNFDMALGTGTFLGSHVMEEIWKPIVGYEGFYDVSNMGKVRSYRVRGKVKTSGVPQRILAHTKNNNGYFYISLWKNLESKKRYVHILVLETFNGPKPDGMEVMHVDGNQLNNNIDNLKWATHRQNMSDPDSGICGTRQWMHILNEDKVREIRRLHSAGVPVKKIQAMYGMSFGGITSVIYRQKWRWVK
jgi:hypothetical protein